MALKVLIMAIIIVVAVVVIALIILSRIAHTLHAPSVEWCLRLASEHAHGCFLKQPNTQSQLMYGAIMDACYVPNFVSILSTHVFDAQKWFVE